MSATDYIISSLERLSNLICGINIRYAYDDISEFHIIEISPESIRRGNGEYMKWERNMWKEFYESYPNEDILISEPDETNNMTNILFETTPVRQNHEMKFSFDTGTWENESTFDPNNNNLLAA